MNENGYSLYNNVLKTFNSIFFGHTLITTENTDKILYSQTLEYIGLVEHKNILVNFYFLSS